MRKILMHVGPTVIDPEVLLAGVQTDVGFTSPEFIEASSKVLKGLRYIMGADKTYQPFIIPGGGTAAMESILSLLHEGDRVLVVSNGVFGDRWEGIFKRYRVKVDVMRAEPGEVVEPSAVEEKLSSGEYRAVTLTHVETSTGVRMPIQEVTKRVRRHVDLIIVDGVSSVSAEEVRATEWGVDVYLTASQKALGSPPGAGLLVLSRKAVESIDDKSLAGYFLNLSNWVKVMDLLEQEKGAYFATLPVHVILSLNKSIEMAQREGIDRRVERHSRVAGAIRSGVEGMGCEIVARKGRYSNTVTAVMTKVADPSKVLSTIRDVEGIELAPGVHPKLAGKYFRIGHMGSVNQNDAVATIAALERVLRGLGEPVKLGSGVSAVQEYLTS